MEIENLCREAIGFDLDAAPASQKINHAMKGPLFSLKRQPKTRKGKHMRINTTPGRSKSGRIGTFPYARTLVAASVLSVLAAPAIGFAQELTATETTETDQDSKTQRAVELDAVYVTAERRHEDMQKIGASVSVRTGDTLRSQGKYSLKQILEDVPGIDGGATAGMGGSANGSDTLASGLTIRGIPSNSGTGGGVTSVAAAAAIYVDGVYEGVGGSYDLDRVEVLRGPQGTLYGRSATSGVVAIHTADPNFDGFGGHASVEFGNYSLKRQDVAVNLPLTDTVALRVSANHYERDGYDYGDAAQLETKDARIKLLYKPSDTFSILLGAALQNNTTYPPGDYALLVPNDWEWSPAPLNPGKNNYRQYWAEMDWDLGFANLTYLPALRTWESTAKSSARQTFLSFDQVLETPYDHFTTHELHLSSNADSDIAWQVGALYYKNGLRNRTTQVQVGDTGAFPDGWLLLDSQTSRQTTSTGVFAEATFPIATDWRLTTGLRYDDTKVSTGQQYTASNGETLTLAPDQGTRTFKDVTYKARIEHDLTPQNMVYGMVSTGISPGDMNITTGANGGPEVVLLEPEKLTAYEVGSKNSFLDRSLLVNGALFYYDYGGYQTAALNVSPNPANPIFTTLTTPLKSYGAELEVTSVLSGSDRLMFNASYTHARYVDKDKAKLADGTSFGDYYALDTVAGVVPFKASLAYEHDFAFAGGSWLSLRGDVSYASPHDEGQNILPVDVEAGYAHYQRAGSQLTGNLSGTWTSPHQRYSVTGYVRNITDKRSIYGVFRATQDYYTAHLSAPRTLGVVLTMNFGQ